MFMFIMSVIFAIGSFSSVVQPVGSVSKVVKSIQADAETDPVKSWFDAADDPAIWVHPKDPNKSKLIGTDKRWGVLVYNLDGKKVYSYPYGKINNVDVRYNFALGDESIDILGGTNRSNNTIVLYRVLSDGRLANINGNKINPNMKEVYGFSLYHSLRTGKYYALVVGKKGEFEQYELVDNGDGRIDGKKVRSFQLGSQAEGIVADDEYGHMFIAEEKGPVWKYDAEPEGTERIKIAYAGDGNLTAEIEGLTIYYATDGKGYLLISSQGDSTYAIYDRQSNQYIGSFEIVSGVVDGVSDSDGIDVISFGLGSKYPNGLFITQDGFNNDGWWIKKQNFKIVSWEKIAVRFGLSIDNQVDPRKLILREAL